MRQSGLLFLSVCLVLPAPARARAAFSDQAVEQAIRRGVEYLWSKQLPAGTGRA